MAILSTRTAGDDYAIAFNALVIADRADDARDTAEALALSGVRTGAPVRFADASRELAERPRADMILIEVAGAPDALLDGVLAQADTMARERGAALIAAFDADQIDPVAAQLAGRHCQLLCEPGMAERVAALSIAKVQAGARGDRVRMSDASRDGEDARLQRLNEEVARIAETLARLTRGDDGERGGVREAPMRFAGQEDSEQAPVTPQEIRAAIRSRRLRGQFFHGELFADPAWDMLLDLFAAELEQRQVSVSSLCIAAAVPPTTALRWIGTLHDAGLFERRADPADRRRAYIVLTRKGLEGMRAYIAEVKRLGLAIA